MYLTNGIFVIHYSMKVKTLEIKKNFSKINLKPLLPSPFLGSDSGVVDCAHCVWGVFGPCFVVWFLLPFSVALVVLLSVGCVSSLQCHGLFYDCDISWSYSFVFSEVVRTYNIKQILKPLYFNLKATVI